MQQLYAAQKQIVILFVVLLTVIVLLLGATTVYAERFYRTNTLSAAETFSLRATMAYNELTAYTTLAHWTIETAERAAMGSLENPEAAALAVLQRDYDLSRWTSWAIIDMENWTLVHYTQNQSLIRRRSGTLTDLAHALDAQSGAGTVVTLRLANGTREPAVVWPIDLHDGTFRAAMLRVNLAEILRPMTAPLDTELQIDLVDGLGRLVMPLSLENADARNDDLGTLTIEPRGDRETSLFAAMYDTAAFGTPVPTVYMEDNLVFSFVPIPTVDAGFVLQDRQVVTAQRVARMYWTVGIAGSVLVILLTYFFYTVRRNLLSQGTRLSRAVADKNSLLLLLSHKLRNSLTTIDAEIRQLEGPAGTIRRTVRHLSRIVADALYYSQFHDKSEIEQNPAEQEVTCSDMLDFLAIRIAEDANDADITIEFVPPSAHCTAAVNLSTVLDALERVLLLVISTARPGFHCRIGVRKTDSGTTIRVEATAESIERFCRFSSGPFDLNDNPRMKDVDLYVTRRLLDSIGAKLRYSVHGTELLIDLPTVASTSSNVTGAQNIRLH